MTEWRETTLGELIEVKHGYAFKGEYFELDGDEIVLTPGNFPIGGGLQFRKGKDKYYRGPYPNEFRLKPGDLLVVMTDLTQEAPILGSPAVVPAHPTVLHNQRLGLVRVKPGIEVDKRFLYYLLLSDGTRRQLRATATGSTVRHTAPSRIYDVRIRLPELGVQRALGQILGVLDDLIENNRRRVGVLERITGAIYREWFGRLRFPGHESTTLIDSSTGPIPKGWEVGDLTGTGPFRLAKRRVEDFSGRRRYLATADCSGFNRVGAGRFLTFSELPTRAQLQPVPESIFFGRMAGYQKVLTYPSGSPELECDVLSSGFACVVADPGWFSFVLATILDESFEPKKSQYATGATQVSLTDDGARRIPWLVPSRSVAEHFEAVARPLYLEVLQLMRVSRKAVEVRNLLIPHLMLGQVGVSHLDLDAILKEAG